MRRKTRHIDERKRLHLKLIRISRGDYFNGMKHDLDIFEDKDGNAYYYQAPYSGENAKTKFSEAIAFCENQWFDISAEIYGEPDDTGTYYLHNPRILKTT